MCPCGTASPCLGSLAGGVGSERWTVEYPARGPANVRVQPGLHSQATTGSRGEGGILASSFLGTPGKHSCPHLLSPKPSSTSGRVVSSVAFGTRSKAIFLQEIQDAHCHPLPTLGSISSIISEPSLPKADIGRPSLVSGGHPQHQAGMLRAGGTKGVALGKCLL